MRCSNCDEKAIRQDDIYCPVSFYSCGYIECDVAVALMLWEEASKEVEEE